MTLPWRRRRTRTRGQAIVELALLLPLLLLLLSTAADLGRIFHSQITVAHAARAGALEASRHPTSYVSGGGCDPNVNRIYCAIVAESTGSILTVTPLSVQVTCTPSPCAEALGNTIAVTVSGQFHLITPFMGAFFGGQTFPIASTAIAQIAVKPVITPAATPTPTPSSTPTPTPTPSPTPTGTPGPTPTPSPTPSPTPICFPPTADFVFSPGTGKKKVANFSFNDLSTTAADCPLTWSWNFGDGGGSSSTSTLQDPTHVYQAQGVYTITLVVSNAGGQDTRTRNVTVTP
jgi:Flp pilus assembly protein TadG